MKTESKLIIQK